MDIELTEIERALLLRAIRLGSYNLGERLFFDYLAELLEICGERNLTLSIH